MFVLSLWRENVNFTIFLFYGDQEKRTFQHVQEHDYFCQSCVNFAMKPSRTKSTERF